MNLNNEEFYKSLKDSLEQLPVPEATEADWQSFKSFQGNTDTKKKKPIFWYILPVSIVTGLFIVLAFVWNNQDRYSVKKAETITAEREGLIAKANPYAGEKQQEQEQGQEKKQGQEQEKEKKQEQEKKQEKKQGQEKEQEKGQEQEKKQEKQKQLKKENGLNINTSNFANVTEPNTLTYKPETPLTALTFIVSATNLEIASRNIGLLPIQPLKLVGASREFGSTRKIKSPLQADWLAVYGLTQTSFNETRPTIGAGFSLGKDLGQGWYVSMGVEYATLNKNQENHWNHQFESHDLIKVDTNLRMDLVANKIVMVMDSVFENRTHNETVKEKTFSTTRNIDIPIEIGYQLTFGKLSLGAMLGIYNRIQYTQTTQQSEFTLRNQNQSNFKETYTYQFMNHAGLSAAYPLSNNLWVQATPMVLMNFLDKQQMFSEGRLRIGLRYYLK